jgi:hypothetical protein
MAKQQGWIYVDHRASPGLTPDQALLNGYDPNLVKEGKVFEQDTFTCSRCRGIVIKNSLRTRERGHCQKCNHFICDYCTYQMSLPDYVHTPFEVKVAKILEYQTPNPLKGNVI